MVTHNTDIDLDFRCSSDVPFPALSVGASDVRTAYMAGDLVLAHGAPNRLLVLLHELGSIPNPGSTEER